MPLLWRIPDDYPQGRIGRYDRSRGPDRFAFMDGALLPEPLAQSPRALFDCREEELSRDDCIWTDARIPIVNERLKAFLSERSLEQMQFVDIEIFVEGKNIGGYYIVNALKTAEIIDIDASIYRCVPGSREIMSFSVLRAKKGGMGALSVGRDRRYLAYLFVADDLASSIEAAGFRGAAMIEPSMIGS